MPTENLNATALSFSPYCRRLCSKKLVFRTSPPRVESDVLDGAAHTWCSRTMDGVGTDGELVGVEDCRADRECFEPYGPRIAPQA